MPPTAAVSKKAGGGQLRKVPRLATSVATSKRMWLETSRASVIVAAVGKFPGFQKMAKKRGSCRGEEKLRARG